MTLLTVDHLRIGVGKAKEPPLAVSGVSLSVAAGTAVALIGESGAGKSLTSMAIAGLLPSGVRITGGTVTLNGSPIHYANQREMRRIRGRQIGVVFQEPMSSLNPTMTVGDQIAEAARLGLGLGRSDARRHALDLLDKVGIANPTRRIDEYPHRLSGGMRQRVMIAIAIACNPCLLIADEPTTALDVTVQAQILDLLRSLQADLGMAILFVTHDLAVVSEFCERVNVMYAGEIVETGETRAVLGSPTHPYTSLLLKSMPNLGQRKTVLPVINGTVPHVGEMPAGCRFQPRCPYGNAGCEVAPSLDVVTNDRLTRCRRVLDGTLSLTELNL